MNSRKIRSLAGAAALCLLTGPAFADDCAPVISSTIASAKAPHSSTVARTDASGHSSVGHLVQTTDLAYIERNGKWVSLKNSSQDLVDRVNENLKTTKLTCTRSGTEAINGEPTTVYTVHTENEGSTSDAKVWISAQNLQVKTDVHTEGTHAVTTVDYAHVKAPEGAAPLARQ